MAKVSLIDITANAVDKLIFSKQTRLRMEPGLLADIGTWPQDKVAEELRGMARTIRSSWEFVSLTFLVENTTRAIAQQITRTRTASYAMQSMRVLDVGHIGIENPYPVLDVNHERFERAADNARAAYKGLLAAGSTKEDARGIMPLNTHTTLLIGCNLRNFVDLVAKRRSLRAQGEYAQIVTDMRDAVLAAEPRLAVFFEDAREEAFTMLEEAAQQLGITPGEGTGWQIAKAVDLLRQHG